MEPLSVALQNLHAFEDRAALERLVLQALSPPEGLARLHGRACQEEVGKPSGLDVVDELFAKGVLCKGDERVAHEVAQQHLRWTGRGLREFFLSQAHQMLEWSGRLHLKSEIMGWSPAAWVEASHQLEATPELLGLVIEHAPTPSWSVWRSAFGFQSCWPEAWKAWEVCFFRSPSLALRWLDDLLAERPAAPAPGYEECHALLGALRARLAVCLLEETLQEKAYRQLDQRLANEGATLQLQAVDWSFVVLERGKARTPAEARELLLKFLRAQGEATRRWLEQTPSSLAALKKGLPNKIQLRQVRVACGVLGYHHQASASALQAVLQAFSTTCPGAEAPGWKGLIDGRIFKEWNVEKPTVSTAPTVAQKVTKPPAAVPPVVKKTEGMKAATPAMAASSGPEDFPRFARR